MFAPNGALSSAKFRGEDVTKKIRHVRAEDYAQLLIPFGFHEHPDHLREQAYQLAQGWAAKQELQVFNMEKTTDYWLAHYCETGKDTLLPVQSGCAMFMIGETFPGAVWATGEPLPAVEMVE